MTPKIIEERKLWRQGYRFVACIDEAGRGPLAGPVIACAVVILPKSDLGKTKSDLGNLGNIRDSKKLSPKRREKIYAKISNHPGIQWRIGIVSEKVIDRINIFQATKLAMIRAVTHLQKKLQSYPVVCFGDRSRLQQNVPRSSVGHLIIDGNFRIDSIIPQKSIVKGDEKVFSCALASIIAKVARDRMMVRYHKKYPQYGFDRHKGYGTKLHFEMLKKYGPCSIHRRSFAPVATMLKSQIRNSKFETNSKFKYSKF